MKICFLSILIDMIKPLIILLICPNQHIQTKVLLNKKEKWDILLRTVSVGYQNENKMKNKIKHENKMKVRNSNKH